MTDEDVQRLGATFLDAATNDWTSPLSRAIYGARRETATPLSILLAPQALGPRGVVLVTANAVANTGDCHG